jgi:hypothetical protein
MPRQSAHAKRERHILEVFFGSLPRQVGKGAVPAFQPSSRRVKAWSEMRQRASNLGGRLGFVSEHLHVPAHHLQSIDRKQLIDYHRSHRERRQEEVQDVARIVQDGG